jgi:hypothetical protein
MAIRILKVSCVATPESVPGRSHNGSAGILCLLHHRIDFSFGSNIVCKCELRGSRVALWDASVLRDARSRPDGEFQSCLQIKEGNRSVLKLLPDDAFGFESQSVTVEMQRALEVVHAEGNHCDSCVHGWCVSGRDYIEYSAEIPHARVANDPPIRPISGRCYHRQNSVARWDPGCTEFVTDFKFDAGATDIDGLRIRGENLSDISGRVRIVDRNATILPDFPYRYMVVMFSQAATPIVLAVRTDGSFTATLPGGEYSLITNTLPDGYTLKSVAIGDSAGAEITKGKLKIDGRAVPEILVTLEYRPKNNP